jgi:hypothetical protein
VLYGCPALTAISDPAWFSQYEDQLTTFAKDIDRYSANAWTETVGWEVSLRDKWAGGRHREIISHDQDFLRHLIHTDKIIQDKPSKILEKLRAYILFENPLYMHDYENRLENANYSRNMDVEFINRRRVLLWHMQNDFVRYLGKFIFAKKYLPSKFLGRISNDLEIRDLYSYMYDFACRYLGKIPLTRLEVYRYFFEETDFREVLNGRIWWKPGVFS